MPRKQSKKYYGREKLKRKKGIDPNKGRRRQKEKETRLEEERNTVIITKNEDGREPKRKGP